MVPTKIAKIWLWFLFMMIPMFLVIIFQAKSVFTIKVVLNMKAGGLCALYLHTTEESVAG